MKILSLILSATLLGGCSIASQLTGPFLPEGYHLYKHDKDWVFYNGTEKHNGVEYVTVFYFWKIGGYAKEYCTFDMKEHFGSKDVVTKRVSLETAFSEKLCTDYEGLNAGLQNIYNEVEELWATQLIISKNDK